VGQAHQHDLNRVALRRSIWHGFRAGTEFSPDASVVSGLHKDRAISERGQAGWSQKSWLQAAGKAVPWPLEDCEEIRHADVG
jgi:hypothetical protein